MLADLLTLDPHDLLLAIKDGLLFGAVAGPAWLLAMEACMWRERRAAR